MKRTTLILDEACLEGVRELAHRQKRHMSDVVNEILSEGLRKRTELKPEPLQLLAFPMGRPRVHLGDRNALEAVMDS